MLLESKTSKKNQMRLIVNGIEYEQFLSGSVEKSMDNACGGFTFRATANQTQDFPFKLGDKVQVILAGFNIIKGFIYNISVDYSASSHTLTISGRDATGDLIDSNVVGDINFNAPVKLEEVAKRITSNLGLDVEIKSDIANVEPFNASEIVSASPDEKAYALIEKYARKRQLITTTDGDGNLLFTRNGVKVYMTYLNNVINGQNNNVLSAKSELDDNGRFSKVKFISQSNRAASNNTDTANNQAGEAQDNEVRPSRQKVCIAETSTDNLDLGNRSKFEVNKNKSNGLKYSAAVQGFIAEAGGDVIKDIWRPNQKCIVNDDFCNVRAEMLIKKCSYTYDMSGSITSLELVPQEAFTLEEPVVNKGQNEIGGNLR